MSSDAFDTFDPDRVSTITFDSYSTIVDVASAAEALEPYVDDPEAAATLWRSHSLFYTMEANFIGEYEPFYELNRHAATYALETFGADVDEATRDEITSIYHDLHVFEDVREGMERLSSEYDLYVVSNGNPEMLSTMVETADIGGLIEDTVSAEEVETFKPDAEIYRHAAARTGTPIEEIAHVSAGWFDVHGSASAGMQAVWVNRDGGPWTPYGPEPDLEIASFGELADELGC
jgi:2-haloacid dehalogenase